MTSVRLFITQFVLYGLGDFFFSERNPMDDRLCRETRADSIAEKLRSGKQRFLHFPRFCFNYSRALVRERKKKNVTNIRVGKKRESNGKQFLIH